VKTLNGFPFEPLGDPGAEPLGGGDGAGGGHPG